MVRLALLGCLHFNRQRYTADDLERITGDGEYVSGDPDAIAVEYPQFESRRAWALAVLYSPVVTIGSGVLGLFFQLPLFALAARDVLPTEVSLVLNRNDGRPIHLVDRHPLAVLRERSPLWALSNWAVVLAAAWLAPLATATVVGVGILGMLPTTVRLLSGRRWLGVVTLAGALVASAAAFWIIDWSWALAFGAAIAVLAVFVATAHDRNHVMLDACRQIADEEGYEELCLVTGRAHLAGMGEVVDQYDLTIDRVLSQEWFDRGQFVDPERLEEDTSAMNLGVDPEPERTAGVLRRRVFAAVVDTTIVAVASICWLVVLALAIAPVESVYGAESLAFGGVALGVALAWFLVPGGYFVWQELRFGQTIGHRLAGLEVVSVDDGKLERRQVLFRTAGRLLDFLPACYLLGFLVAWSGDGSRRLGDLRIGTAVVRADEGDRSSPAD